MWNQGVQTMGHSFGMSHSVAHEINNQLSVLSGYSEMLYLQMCASGAEKEWIQMMALQKEVTRKLVTLVRDAKDSGGLYAAQLEEVNVEEVVLSVSQMSRQMLQTEGVRLVLQAYGGTALIRGNAGRLEQALLNLMINSRHALEGSIGDRLILVETRRSCGKVFLSVSDNGGGISPENIGKVFEPRFTTKAPGKGSGMGLSIVKRLVELWGGEINLRSEVGSGTTVTMSFPALGC